MNFSDINGGAARAAFRLHKGLVNYGVDSHYLVQNKSSDFTRVQGTTSKKLRLWFWFRSFLDNLLVKLYKNRSEGIFSVSILPCSNLVNRINKLKPDIVHLHWVNAGMLNINDLAKIKAPIVWSLHDMWPFTGGCHYDEFCGLYKSDCGNCKVLGSKLSFDLSSIVQSKKKKVYKKLDLTPVGLSNWMASSAKMSQLFQDKEVRCLPNPINASDFFPLNKKVARNLLGLPEEKKLVLFGAMFATSDPRKGFNELLKALKLIDQDLMDLVVFGSSKPERPTSFLHEVHYMGQLYDDLTLRVMYSAADVMLVPSIQENLSNAIVESLACGTPVVAFDIGGNSDMVDHEVNGYLAKAYDVEDLANGIMWILKNESYSSLALSSRQKVLECFDEKVVVEKYVDLYEAILAK